MEYSFTRIPQGVLYFNPFYLILTIQPPELPLDATVWTSPCKG